MRLLAIFSTMVQQFVKNVLLFLLLNVVLVSIVNAAVISSPPPVSGRNPASIQQIIPADVLARVNLLSKELNLVREAMGKPEVAQVSIKVSNASPREVYFEAQALFEKANRLANEVVGSHELEPEVHTDILLPAHVWQLVDQALKRILIVKERLGIQDKVHETAEPITTTSSDVFNAILHDNQILNNLLYHPVSPSVVFGEVTLAINYTSYLLKTLDIAPRIPEPDAFVAKKTPANVYQRLIECIHFLQTIAKNSNVEMLHVTVQELGIQQVSPSNVFDLSKIIVSEVRHLNTFRAKPETVKVYFPGYKTPSDVFQRAGILLKQLEALDVKVKQDPGWAKKNEGVAK